MRYRKKSEKSDSGVCSLGGKQRSCEVPTGLNFAEEKRVHGVFS
jgi:hypothetical protein